MGMLGMSNFGTENNRMSTLGMSNLGAAFGTLNSGTNDDNDAGTLNFGGGGNVSLGHVELWHQEGRHVGYLDVWDP